MVAAASIDRIVHVWSTQTHKLLHRLDGHTESVYAVTFSHDGNTLVSGGLDKTIKVRPFSVCIFWSMIEFVLRERCPTNRYCNVIIVGLCYSKLVDFRALYFGR